MVDPDSIDAVVFDMGGVFVVPHHEPIGAAIKAAGVELSPEPTDAHRAHYHGVRAITERLEHEEVVEADLGVWSYYDRAYFSSIGVPSRSLDAVIEARDAQRKGGVQGIWRLRLTHNIEGFARIAESLSVAIVTNNDGTAVRQCVEFEICQIGEGPLPSVAAIVDSTALGIAKPDPRIFEPALEALGTTRERTLYVGDTVHADVLGAEAAGMPVVQLDPFDLHDDHDHWRLPDVVALADHLVG